jgi:hypothetical protein
MVRESSPVRFFDRIEGCRKLQTSDVGLQVVFGKLSKGRARKQGEKES